MVGKNDSYFSASFRNAYLGLLESENSIKLRVISLFLITFANEGQLLINYKEAIENRPGKHKITATYKTDWMPLDQIKLAVEGLNMDKVYESFVAQIADSKLIVAPDTDIKQAIVDAQTKEKIKKEIALLEAKMKKEKQFNIQLKISNEIKLLQKMLHEELGYLSSKPK